MRSQQQYGVLTVGIAVACTVQYSTVSPLGIKRRRSACVMGTHGSDVTSICPDFRRGAPLPVYHGMTTIKTPHPLCNTRLCTLWYRVTDDVCLSLYEMSSAVYYRTFIACVAWQTRCGNKFVLDRCPGPRAKGRRSSHALAISASQQPLTME
jgi:hypothetical protein